MGINFRKVYKVDLTPAEIMEKFQQALDRPELPVVLQIANRFITLKVKSEEQRWWSPELNLRVESRKQGSRLHELVGPNPAIFTLSIFFVILGSVTFLAAVMLALSQIHLDTSPRWAVLGSLFSVLIVSAALLTLAVGRMKAVDQVQRLRDAVYGITGMLSQPMK